MASILLTLLLLLWTATQALSAPVQSRPWAATAASGSESLAYLSNVSAGSCLLIACAVYQAVADATNPTFSDTLGNTYTVVRNQAGGAAPNLSRIYIAVAPNPSSGTNSVTCNPPGGTGEFITLVITEYTGLATACTVDQAASQDNTGSTVSSGNTPTTTQANEVVFAAMTYDGVPDATITEQGPCALIQEHETQSTAQPINVCDFTVSATGVQSASWVLGGNRDGPGAVATFQLAIAAPVTRRGGPLVFP